MGKEICERVVEALKKRGFEAEYAPDAESAASCSGVSTCSSSTRWHGVFGLAYVHL